MRNFFLVVEKGNYPDCLTFQFKNCMERLKVNVPEWMHPAHADEDDELLEWLNSAEIGETFEFRAGVCIRLKDIAKSPY